MKSKTKRITLSGLFISVAVILILVENALPPMFFFAPGARLGLSNVAILLALVILGAPEAFIILIVKCLLSAIFAGNVVALMYAVPAGLISYAIQYLMYRFLFPKVGLISISLMGAIAHNMIQLLIASLIVGQSLFYLMPLLVIAGTLAGLFIGFTTYLTVKNLPKKVLR